MSAGDSVAQEVREVGGGLTLQCLPDHVDKYVSYSYCNGEPLEAEVESGEELTSSDLHF